MSNYILTYTQEKEDLCQNGKINMFIWEMV